MGSLYERIKPYVDSVIARLHLGSSDKAVSSNAGWRVITEGINPELKRHYEGWTIMADYNRDAERLIDFLNSSIPLAALTAYAERHTSSGDSLSKPEALKFNRGIVGNNLPKVEITRKKGIGTLSASWGRGDNKVIVERSLESILQPTP